VAIANRQVAEDTEDPRTEIPRSLLLSTTVNSFSCIIVAILVVFCAGDPNLFTGDLALSGHPLASIMQLFYDATRGNKNAACSVFALSAIIFAVCTVNTTTTSSRMLFSLVRDGHDPIVIKLLARVSTRLLRY
jgi:amino acid transporter